MVECNNVNQKRLTPFFYIISQLLKNQLVSQNHKPSIHSIDSMVNEYSLLNLSPNLWYGIKR